MKTYLMPSLKLTLMMIILCSVLYPLVLSAIALMAPGGGNGVTLEMNGKVVGYENIGQRFTQDRYFWGRPSAAAYNAAASCGSNKGPSNPGYLEEVQARIDTFLVHNPGITKTQIPSELVTASGSGLDPDISVDAARIQARRIASVRNMEREKVLVLIDQHAEGPLFGLFGPGKINVLKLNIALDQLKSN